ncbi:hypothetical protein F7725_013704 [Dissostichus mawsoni]|uniref:Uncharacterized protein n=1 Tax=Dissostichus mawsoni TaxID=36200 RepID=A0A7J5YU74_DISMA|nr:hypothetical protein F7725_013704 [Dissostichus mawsoni]
MCGSLKAASPGSVGGIPLVLLVPEGSIPLVLMAPEGSIPLVQWDASSFGVVPLQQCIVGGEIIISAKSLFERTLRQNEGTSRTMSDCKPTNKQKSNLKKFTPKSKTPPPGIGLKFSRTGFKRTSVLASTPDLVGLRSERGQEVRPGSRAPNRTGDRKCVVVAVRNTPSVRVESDTRGRSRAPEMD